MSVIDSEMVFRSPVIEAGLRYWRQVRGGREMPARADLDPAAMVAVLPNLMLIDVLREPLDFRYRLIGTLVEEFMSERYTGCRLSEIPHQAPPSKVWDDCIAALNARRPVTAEAPNVGPKQALEPPEVVLMPLSDDGAEVTMLMVVMDFFGRADDEHRLPGS